MTDTGGKHGDFMVLILGNLAPQDSVSKNTEYGESVSGSQKIWAQEDNYFINLQRIMFPSAIVGKIMSIIFSLRRRFYDPRDFCNKCGPKFEDHLQ